MCTTKLLGYYQNEFCMNKYLTQGSEGGEGEYKYS